MSLRYQGFGQLPVTLQDTSNQAKSDVSSTRDNTHSSSVWGGLDGNLASSSSFENLKTAASIHTSIPKEVEYPIVPTLMSCRPCLVRCCSSAIFSPIDLLHVRVRV